MPFVCDVLAFNVSPKRHGAKRNKLNFGYALFQRYLHKVLIVQRKTGKESEISCDEYNKTKDVDGII